jgi:hypothetical protein
MLIPMRSFSGAERKIGFFSTSSNLIPSPAPLLDMSLYSYGKESKRSGKNI